MLPAIQDLLKNAPVANMLAKKQAVQANHGERIFMLSSIMFMLHANYIHDVSQIPNRIVWPLSHKLLNTGQMKLILSHTP